MGIFADILNPNNKKTAKDIISSTKPAGSTNLPIETTSTVKTNANKILANVKAGGSTPIPQPITIPKRGEVISQASQNVTPTMPFKIKAEEGKRIAEQLMDNQYDDDTVAGIVQNTIKGIPKATTDVLVDILQATSRAVGSVGITAGNAFTNAMGIGPIFEDEIDTKQTEFSKILFGGKPVKTVQKSISDVAEKYVKPTLAMAGFGEDTAVGKSSLIQKGLAVPLVAGGLALDLTGFGGKAGIKSFTDEIPEAFLKRMAKEKSPQVGEEILKSVGLDDINAKNLAFELAPINTVDEVKNILINYGKEQQTSKGVFSNILKEGQQSVDNVVEKGIIKPENMTDVEFNKFIKTPEGIAYAKKTESNIPEKSKDQLFGDINQITKRVEKTDPTKYKTADEFINAQSNIAEYSPLDNKNTERSIKNLNEAGIKVNNGEDIITLYHGTNAKGVKGINESKSLNPFSYLATDKNASKGFVFGRGGDIFEIKVPVKDAGFVLTSMAGSKGATIQNPVRLIKGDDNIWRAEQWKSKSELKKIWEEANKKPSIQKPEIKPYKETGNLTTKILKDLEGKTTVSRQYILDSTKRQGISGSEVKIINDVLAKTKGDVIDVAKFAEKVKKELLPLKTTSSISEADSQTISEDEAIQAIKDGKKVWGVETDYDDNITLSPTPLRLKDILNEDGDSYEYYTTNKGIEKEFIAKYEFVSLPKDVKGNVVSYKENVYEGKIRTDGSESHFPEQDKYILHTRIENMGDGKTRRVIEVQSDLYQKGNLENVINLNAKDIYDKKGNAKDLGGIKLIGKEVEYKNEKYKVVRSSTYGANVDIQNIKTGGTLMKIPVDYFIKSEFNTLNQYKNPTIHFRGVREEIKKAVDDGIEKLQFPTGETAMKIEGLGSRNVFALVEDGSTSRTMLSPENAKVGMEVRRLGNDGRADNWVITNILDNGKFDAVSKSMVDRYLESRGNINDNYKNISYKSFVELANPQTILNLRPERFDISGKVDTSNPIYKFYENDLAKYLKNNYDAKLVTDNKGVTWNEVAIKPEMGGPITAFKRTQGKLDYGIKIKSSEVKKIIGEQLKGIVDPEKINWVFDPKLIKQDVLGRFSFDPRMEYLNPRLKPMIEIYENWGKVSAGTVFHESYHYIETKIFSKEFVKKLDRMTLEHITKDDIKYYRKQGYKSLREILAEYRADAFATERLAKGGFKKGKMQKVLELMDKALRKLVLGVKKFVNYYKNLPNKQGGFAKNPFAKKIKEELPEDLQRMKDMIDIKEEVLAMNPVRKLAKYESKAYPGELPEFTGTKMGGKIYKGAYQKVAEDISKEIKYDETLDIKDVEEMYRNYVKQRKELVEYKREYQKLRVEYYANKKNEISKKTMVEKDEKALERILNQNAQETQDLLSKKERDDRMKVQIAETQRRLADEQKYRKQYSELYREARKFTLKDNSIYGAIKRSLKPINSLEPKTREIFKNWKTKLIIGKELANTEASAYSNIPAKTGMDIINSYESGKKTEYTDDIKKAFDSLRQEAISRDLEVNFRSNYLPHVYKENATEIKNAIANYMVDKGVDKAIIDDYMDGITDLSPELANSLKLNPSFTKERTLPTYKVALEYGLHPKYENPAQLIAHYREEMEKTVANRELMKELERNAKILPSNIAPSEWDEVKLVYGGQKWFAKKELAKIINGQIQDTQVMGITDKIFNITATASKKMQEIALSAGVPKSNLNFFSIGVAIKELTSGNVKALSPFIRANFNQKSINYFKDNSSVIKDMAKQGIDISGRIGNYKDVYNTLSSKWSNKEYRSLIGDTFDKLFNEKTFGSFMPQLYMQTFKDASKRAIKSGATKEEADKLAGDVVRNMFGIIEDVGRSKSTEDKLSAIFFAPKFRESIINVFLNTAKAGSTEFRNPAFYRNRRLIAGMIISYALYNYLNYKMNGNYMWDNENGKEFDLKIPRENGEIVYLSFMPSQLSFIRNLASGIINLGKGDLKTATKKFGNLLSMPIKLAFDIGLNSDYFDRNIYKDTDTTPIKSLKIAKYIGLSVNHPYVKELINQIGDKKPLYQSISTALEFPFKFSTQDKVAQNRFYEAMDKARLEQVRAKEKFMPTYNKIVDLIDQEKDSEAYDILDSLSDDEYEMYKNIKTSEKRSKTITNKTMFTSKYNEIISLKNSGNVEKAQAMVDSLSDEDYKSYESLKKQFNGKLAK